MQGFLIFHSPYEDYRNKLRDQIVMIVGEELEKRGVRFEAGEVVETIGNFMRRV